MDSKDKETVSNIVRNIKNELSYQIEDDGRYYYADVNTAIDNALIEISYLLEN